MHFGLKVKFKHCSSITSDQLITYVEYLIDNIFISIGNHVFIGIPMGTDCAPLLANLFLFHFEYSYIKEKLSKADYSMALSYKYTVRYIDDLLTFNNPSFEGNIATIYPPELTLKKTTESSNRLSYLDIVSAHRRILGMASVVCVLVKICMSSISLYKLDTDKLTTPFESAHQFTLVCTVSDSKTVPGCHYNLCSNHSFVLTD